MRMFRLVMASPHTEFIFYEYGISAPDAEKKAFERFEGQFVAVSDRTTEVIK